MSHNVPAASPRELLEAMFRAAIASAQPGSCVPPHLPERPGGRLIVVGAGKAAAGMARAAEVHYGGGVSGVVVVPDGHGVPCEHVTVLEAAHPVPDARGLAAAKRALELVRGLSRDDLVLCLLSGGGSALWPLPVPQLTLEEKRAINAALLASGASIAEINCVRRHLSLIKGGRLAAACHPARVEALLISDVPGDDPADVASGPTVGDVTTCGDALDVLHRYDVAIPEAVRTALERGEVESVKPHDTRLSNTRTRIVAASQSALEAAACVARGAGVTPHILGSHVEGESREVGKVMAAIARQVARHEQPFRAPCVLLSGGETTVTVKQRGRGGRNVEHLLSLAIALRGLDRVHALAGDTDGIDGAAPVAGACLAPDTLARAEALGLRASRSLAAHDAHAFFAALGDAIVTGPTLTNVNDFRAILVTAP